MLRKTNTVLIGFMSLILLFSCKNNDDVENPNASPQDIHVNNLNGGTIGEQGSKPGLAETIYYSLTQVRQVAAADNWDIQFSGVANTDIVANSDANTWLYVANTDYDLIRSRPSVNYNLIKSGNGSTDANGWYSYDITTHIVTAIVGKTVLIKTNEGRVFKLNMRSIYENAPVSPTRESEWPYISFRFAELF